MICTDRLGGEAWVAAADIGAVEFRVFVNLTCKIAAPERAKGDEADSELFTGGQHFGFGFSPPDRIFALDGGHALNGMGAADEIGAGFRQPEMFDLSGLNELFDRPGYILDGNVRVGPVLIE